MPLGYPPSVFISSTCYDLGQVRLDLKSFVESLGYEAVISENSAFPVNPQADNVENCLVAVKNRADIFVLVVGARYGTKTISGKSITNHEYLEAREKGVPIYVFLAQSIIHNLPIWRLNKDGNFSNIVDDVRLFEFAQELQGIRGHWVFGFNSAQDIISALRNQWALLFTEALNDRAKLSDPKLSKDLVNLPAAGLRILLERPAGWKFSLFSAVLRHQIGLGSDLRKDVRYALRLGNGRSLDSPLEIANWIQCEIATLIRLSESSDKIINSVLKEAFEDAEAAAGPELIVYGAIRLGRVYVQLLEWTVNFVSADLHEAFNNIQLAGPRFTQDFIEKIEGLPALIDRDMEKGREAVAAGLDYNSSLTLNLDSPDTDEFFSELETIMLGFGDFEGRNYS